MPVSLRFSFDAVRNELESMQRVARTFMDGSSETGFAEALASLAQIRSTGRSGAWSVQQASPLKTIPSDSYEKDGRAAYSVYGELSWKWSLLPVRPTPKVSAEPSVFEVNGLAAVAIYIRKVTDGAEVAHWTAELGAVDSPGCYFHTHINSAICVPRLPSLFVTPMDALEFLLGELFQNQWPEHASSETGDVQYWRSKQSKLIAKVLEWKRKRIQEVSGSPWVALKNVKPEQGDELFVSKRQ